jgi:hypothetical protein
MPKRAKKPMATVGPPHDDPLSTEDAVDANDNASIATDGETDSEHPAKRVKGESTTTDSSPEPVWEVIERPPLHTEWTDIPDWSQREDCPLIDRLPVEVLDKIFRVRPELQVRRAPLDGLHQSLKLTSSWSITLLWRGLADSFVIT